MSVREIAQLHRRETQLHNLPEDGAEAMLTRGALRLGATP